jgi:hypothetical protein
MNGLLKTLIKPDWNENPKKSLIIQAANLLQIGEFQLIQLAYKSWYSKELPEDRINNIFTAYMLTGIIPIWVTYYAGDILKLDKANLLDSYNTKYHIYDNEFGESITDEKKRKKRGIVYALIIFFIFIGGYYMAITFSGESAGFYPPYIEKKVVYPELYKKDSRNGFGKI